MKNWKTKMKFGLVPLFAGLFAGGIAHAQGGYYGDGYGGADDDYVIIYEHCDFRGDSRALDIGDYRRMRDIGFDNDTMSSIRVPRGLEVTIYEHDKFGGAYATIDRDIACFDRSWNDQVSSIRVDAPGYNDRARHDRQRGYDDYQGNRSNHRTRGNNAGGDYQLNPNVTGKNVSQVVFGDAVLQQVSKKQWQMNSPRGGVAQYKETSRDKNSVYLQNNYTAERVRIDLFANDVTFINRQGQQQRYSIVRKQAALATNQGRNNNNQRASNSSSGQNRTIRRDCFTFRAYTQGGNGGLRFHGKDEYYRFNKKAKSDRICHNGKLTMEMTKTEPGTTVIVEIDGNRYRFGRNEQHDEFKNSWYRKYIRLRVGR